MPKTATDFLMVRLAEGLAGWLSYQQVARRNPIYSEYLLYPPIFEMASGRGWNALPQKSMPREQGQQGAPRTLDFVFARPPQGDRAKALAALEIKFAHPKRGLPGRVQNDIAKLSGISSAQMGLEEFGDLKVYLMIVGQAKSVASSCLTQGLENLPDQIQRIENDDDLQASVYGWMRQGGGDHRWRFRVYVLRRQDWWTGIRHASDEGVEDHAADEMEYLRHGDDPLYLGDEEHEDFG